MALSGSGKYHVPSPIRHISLQTIMTNEKPNTARIASEHWDVRASLSESLSRPVVQELTEALNDVKGPSSNLAAMILVAELAPRTALSTEEVQSLDSAVEEISRGTKCSRWLRFVARTMSSKLPELYSLFHSMSSIPVKPGNAEVWDEVAPSDLTLVLNSHEPPQPAPYKLSAKSCEGSDHLDVLFNRQRESAPRRKKRSPLPQPRTRVNPSSSRRMDCRTTEMSSAYIFRGNDLVALGDSNFPTVQDAPTRTTNAATSSAQAAMPRSRVMHPNSAVDVVNDGYIPSADDTLYVREMMRKARKQRKMQQEREKCLKAYERKKREAAKAREEKERRIANRKNIFARMEHDQRNNNIRSDSIADTEGAKSTRHLSRKRINARPISPPRNSLLGQGASNRSDEDGLHGPSVSACPDSLDFIDLTEDDNTCGSLILLAGYAPPPTSPISPQNDAFQRAVGEYEKNLTLQDADIIRKFLVGGVDNEAGVSSESLFRTEHVKEFVLAESEDTALVLRINRNGSWQRVRYSSS